jgi:hypothetical protein
MAQIVPMMSVNALITQAKAAWDRADQKAADADDWYVRTGKMLVELKERVGHGQWGPTLKKLGRSARRAQELMELAKDAKTVEEQRERKRESVEKTRAKARYVARISPRPHPNIPGGDTDWYDPEEPADEYYGDGIPTSEERWQNSLGNLCGDIIARPYYWDQNFPGWERFECPSHIWKLVEEAATALASITAKVAKRGRKAG